MNLKNISTPNAKGILHECIYHLNDMKKYTHAAKLKINFAAFVNAAINVGNTLKAEYKGKEYPDNAKFKSWYSKKEKEMQNDELCKYFKDTRNKVVHQGINGLSFCRRLFSFDTETDLIDRPNEPHSTVLRADGSYYLIKKGTKEQDLIPATDKFESIIEISIENSPKTHLGQDISNKNILELCEIYYNYLKNLVEEWTEILIHDKSN